MPEGRRPRGVTSRLRSGAAAESARLRRCNWCFWTVVLEKTLESRLDCKGIQPVHSKGDQSWVFFGRTDDEAETLVLWPPHGKSWLIGKDSDAGRDRGSRRRGRQRVRCLDGITDSMDVSEAVGVRDVVSMDVSGSWWWTGRPGVLWFMGSQRVGHDWATELNWTELKQLSMHTDPLTWRASKKFTGAIPQC